MMTETEILKRYLEDAHTALLWKLDGLSEAETRRPMTATGTNLLGLIKHAATMEAGYFGAVLGRAEDPMPWIGPGAEPNEDMYAKPEESREWVVDFFRRAQENAVAAIDELGLDAPGFVPWWGESGREVTVRRVAVHVIAEFQRHAGHADIVRELIDGQAGMLPVAPNLPGTDAAWWAEYRERLQGIADGFEG